MVGAVASWDLHEEDFNKNKILKRCVLNLLLCLRGGMREWEDGGGGGGREGGEEKEGVLKKSLRSYEEFR